MFSCDEYIFTSLVVIFAPFKISLSPYLATFTLRFCLGVNHPGYNSSRLTYCPLVKSALVQKNDCVNSPPSLKDIAFDIAWLAKRYPAHFPDKTHQNPTLLRVLRKHILQSLQIGC